MKIFIAVPTFENIYPDTFKSIYGLDKCGHWVVFDFIRGYDCATARNNIAKQALSENADYVLMVDNDVILPSDALKNMLEEPKDVCLGYYAHRAHGGIYDGRSCLLKLGEYNFTQMYTAKELHTLKESGVYKIEVHGGGMGCALIKTSVFNQLNFPYYDWVNYKNGQMLSEDLYFCSQCGKKGIKIFADTRCECGHIFRTPQYCH